MADKEKTPKPKGGCINRFAVLFLLTMMLGLAAALFQISQPQDLSDIEGRGPGAVGKPSRDLKAVMANALKGGYKLTLTEEEINLYLRDTLKTRQAGLLESQVTLDGIAIRLEGDHAEIIMIRTIAGQPFTVSMYVTIFQGETPNGTIETAVARHGGPYHELVKHPLVGGRFGKLPVPQGFMHLVMPAYTKLATVYRDAEATKPVKELDFIEEMARFSIIDGKLVLDPNPNVRQVPLPGTI
ncbi:MAG: hypothetical protein AAGI48_15845 [Verrucomicrobiota bacterium]